VSKAYADVNRIATEAISEYRTILTLTKETHFTSKYAERSAVPHAAAVKGGFIAAVGFGFSQCVQYFSFALALWYGTKMVIDGKITPLQVMSVIFAIIFGMLVEKEYWFNAFH
jgi:ATP-binding cassette subfamily B (MDR/TAP) protein 1